LAYFMLGNPGETREQMIETIQFAKKIRANFVHFSLTSPFPATELYRLGLEQKIIKKDYWKEFAENPTPDFLPPLWEEKLGREELFVMLRTAYKKFYFRPNYVMQQILKTKSLKEFTRKARAGLKMFKI
jgi:anaerobic magnesium-protoporphyrin IX monomethyl ester cyclase